MVELPSIRGQSNRRRMSPGIFLHLEPNGARQEAALAVPYSRRIDPPYNTGQRGVPRAAYTVSRPPIGPMVSSTLLWKQAPVRVEARPRASPSL